MIGTKTRVYGVIGHPVGHSLSPLMQNHCLERTGADGIYAAFEVEPERLGDMVRGAEAMGFGGINVTVPHKQQVIQYLKETDRIAAAIGAVNTLVPVPGGFKGYNTDAPGLKRAIEEAGVTISGEMCILLGAGGAARAAAFMLAEEGAARILILNRSLEKAVSLAEDVNRVSGRSVAEGLTLESYREISEGSYLAVQCTSVGMHPHTGHAPIEDEAFYRRIHTGVDIVYTPAMTRFMQLTKAAGGRTVGGLDMLIYQGVIAYELWHPELKVDQETIAQIRNMLREQLEGTERP